MSGKTTLAHLLKEKLQRKKNDVLTVIVSIDAVISVEEQTKLIKSKEGSDKWKQIRRNVVEAVDTLLSYSTVDSIRTTVEDDIHSLVKQICTLNKMDCDSLRTNAHGDNIFIIDDNLYYQSMRYEFYQLAKKFRCGFSQMYLQCSSDCAASRNEGRVNRVPVDVISTMANKIETPQPTKHRWEENSVTMCTEAEINEDKITQGLTIIKCALSNPVETVEVDLAEKEKSQLICSTNVLHQIDTTLRKITSDRIKSYKDRVSANDDLRLYSSLVNGARLEVYNDIKKGHVHFSQEMLASIENGLIEQVHGELVAKLSDLLNNRLTS